MTTKALRIYYAALSAVLLIIEILIGMYAHGWVRGSLGDILVIPLIYCLVRIVFPRALPRLMPFLMCCVGFLTEFLQYLKFYEFLGFAPGSLGAIILGTGFSWSDMLCYAAGTAFIYAGIQVRQALTKRNEVTA